MDPKAASSPALKYARLSHLYAAALSLSGRADSSAAFFGDEALSLSSSTPVSAAEARQSPADVLAQSLVRNSSHRRLVGHVEYCNRCGLCLLPGTTARRVVKWTQSPVLKNGKTAASQEQMPRPSKRRKSEWGPRKASSDSNAEPAKAKWTALSAGKPGLQPTSKTSKPQKHFADGRKPPTRRVKSVELHCVKCGGSMLLSTTPSAATAKSASQTHAEPSKSESTPVKPLSTLAAKMPAPSSSKNEKSKQRAKARKQGGLAAEVERNKGAAKDTGGGLGFDLMDFMKG